MVHVDMVGYSRLIGLDDIGTVERLRTLRRDLIDPAIAEHGGRIVQTGGDSLLVVFDSIDGAVRCALKVQQQVPAHDRDQPPDRTIRFRVGINIGDAIADGTDLHGDAVNVAARLQAECPPSGVCVTRAVRDHVRGRLDLVFEELGALSLKNIAEPVEAFVVRPGGATARSVERALVQGTGEALPLPDKPSIAVLAFTNMSGDPEQEYFSDGIADDIITELSRSRSLFVIARNSSFTYKGRATDIRQVARELGVRYVLEGSVRRSGGRVRVVAQLIDAETGNHMWAERYDRALEDVFAVQDEITSAIVTAIHPAVADAEFQRALRKPPESLGAWEAYLRGQWHHGQGTAPDNERAKKFFQQAVAIDANFSLPYVGLARAYLEDCGAFGTRSVQDAAELSASCARKAIAIDPEDADARAIVAWAALMTGNADEARDQVSMARASNPNSHMAILIEAHILIHTGQFVPARQGLTAYLRADPRGPHNASAMHWFAVSYYYERDYAKSVEAARRALARYPDVPNNYRWLAAALGQLGRTEEARAVLHKALELSPRSFEFYTRRRPPWHRPEDYEHMLDGLRKAGWQG
ncbi:MAG TPA: adenylate/guanylate cyclase domain-containing protein [Acetobacteraceae bacterium]|nr:adenylate/guanylate cyclase domain-containing protein [Acetobacteraceae bacterium]